MIIRKIELLNFGPYYDKKIVKFNNGGYGIHIIHGDNGQGKTTLQNAILWALYGKIYHRNGTEIKPTEILNYKARDDGIYMFGVKIFFEHEGRRWILTRKMHAKTFHNKSFNTNMKLHLTKEGEPLENPQLRINRIIPPEVSRFFFFDGEMLGKYEMLLEEDSPGKRELKNSIEKILGIPFVSTAKSDLEELKKKYEKEIRKIFSKIGDKDDVEIARIIDSLENEIDEKKKSLEKIKSQIKKIYDEIYEKKKKEAEYESVRKKVMERDDLEKKLKDIEKELEKLKRKRGDLLKDIYKYTLSPLIKIKIGYVSELYRKEFEKWERKTLLENEIIRIKEQIEKNICPCCGREMDPKKIAVLREELKDKEAELEILSKEPIPNMSIEHMKERLERVLKLTENADEYLSELKRVEESIYLIEARIAEKMKKISDLSEEISKSDVDEVKKLEIEIRRLAAEKGRLEKEREDLEISIEDLKKKKLEYMSRLSHIQSNEVKELKMRVEYINYILNIFEEAIEKYRIKKRQEVEKVSSEIFRKIKTKEGFVGLEIDENYGLWIITKDGARLGLESSAGEEQIVAFCLIGALNKCSSIDAPVFMDTPFGRIDVKHTENILKYLPELSKQVVLLVTSREFKEEDREYIAEHIQTELKLMNHGYKEGTKIEYYKKNGGEK